jgi:hypothetical protein
MTINGIGKANAKATTHDAGDREGDVPSTTVRNVKRICMRTTEIEHKITKFRYSSRERIRELALIKYT